MRYRLVLLLWAVSAHATLLFAQELNHRLFTDNDGLPSSYVYQVLQDKNKFMWFCTSAGVVRYDGTTMVTDKSIPGFTDYGAFHALNDSKRRVWFIPFNGKVCYYEHGRFHRPPAYDPITRESVRWIYERNDTFWFGTSDGKFMATNRHRLIFSFQVSRFPVTTFAPCGNGFLIDVVGLYWLDALGRCPYLVRAPGRKDYIWYTNYCSLPNGDVLVSKRNLLRVVRPGAKQGARVIKEVALDSALAIFSISRDRNGTIWIPTQKQLLYCRDTSLRKFDSMLNGEYVTSVWLDHESNYWVSSLYGVHYIKNLHLKHHTRELGERGVVGIFADHRKQLYVVNSSGSLFELHPEGLIRVNALNSWNAPGGFCQIRYSSDSTTIEIHTNGMDKAVLRNGRISLIGLWAPQLPFYQRKDTAWYFDDLYGIWMTTAHGKQVLEPNCVIDYSIGLLHTEANGNLWLGGNAGLLLIQQNRVTYLGKQHPVGSLKPNQVVQQNDSTLWVSTVNGGIYSIRNGRIVATYSTANGLPSDKCYNLLVDGDYLWVCTNNGICRWKTSNGHLTGKPLLLNTSTGLLSNEVKCAYRQHNLLYVGTTSGLTVFDERALTTFLPPPEVHINQLITPTDTSYEGGNARLRAGTTLVNISYSGISYSSGHDLLYKYNLNPVYPNWQYTSNPNLLFTNLSPGTYTFQVYARNRNHVWSSTPATVTFVINAFWWQTQTFYGLVLLLVTLAVYGFVVYRIKEIKQREQLRNKAIENELNALRAQMNPHFVFNSLNSIQDFILDHKPEEANYYLTRFANLMRLIIDYSRVNEISLKQEIDFLNVYLELEKLRFSHSLIDKIDNRVQEDDMNCLIPPLLVQPVVENAIKYALFNTTGSPAIHIGVSIQQGYVVFAVEDNGPGREAINELKTKGIIRPHQSVGLKNITERLSAIDPGKKSGIVFEDLHANGKPSGTRVLLYIPILKC